MKNELADFLGSLWWQGGLAFTAGLIVTSVATTFLFWLTVGLG